MNNKPIGIIDSGVGGLSIWQEITKLLPHESTIYVADSAHAPYGEKTPEEICYLTRHLLHFLLKKEVKLVVVACNTITVSCLDILRNEFPTLPIIGTVPVIKTAAQKTKNGKIGILSTVRTAESIYQKDLIKKFASTCEVVNIGTNDLVPFVERGVTEGEEVARVLETVLRPFKQREIDILALGCTHYPFLRKSIQRIIGPDTLLFDSGAPVARQVQHILSVKEIFADQKTNESLFFTSGDEENYNDVVKHLLPGYSIIFQKTH